MFKSDNEPAKKIRRDLAHSINGEAPPTIIMPNAEGTMPQAGSASFENFEEAVMLTPAQRDALTQGWYAGQARTGSDFNAIVLASLQNRPGLSTWHAGILARLRLAVVPALLGFVLMYGVSGWIGQRLAAASITPVQEIVAQPAPPLPNLPVAFPEPTQTDRVQRTSPPASSNTSSGGTAHVR